ncbi:MAG: ATP-binding cassette domain-containing protein [Sumerlaeia bacterium]
MIRTHQLYHQFGTTPCLKGLNLEVEAGSILGFLGPNGAGKTTTIRILTGLLRPTQGWASVNGVRVDQNLNALRQILGYLPEEAPAYPEMRIQDFLDFVAGLKGLTPREIKKSVEQVLHEVDLHKDRLRLIGNISKGMRRRVGLAQALLGKPKVLILDEPTDGLDPAQIALVRDLICNLKGKCTVFFSTHILPNVIETCTHVAILSRGYLISQGTIAEIESSKNSVLEITCNAGNYPANPLKNAAEAKGFRVVHSEKTPHGWLVQLQVNDDLLSNRASIMRSLMDEGLELQEFKLLRPSLEDIFLQAISAPEGQASLESTSAKQEVVA